MNDFLLIESLHGALSCWKIYCSSGNMMTCIYAYIPGPYPETKKHRGKHFQCGSGGMPPMQCFLRGAILRIFGVFFLRNTYHPKSANSEVYNKLHVVRDCAHDLNVLLIIMVLLHLVYAKH